MHTPYELSSFDDVARHYRETYAEEAARRMLWFADRRQVLGEAILRACKSEMPSIHGVMQRHPHQPQFRFSNTLLESVAALLQIVEHKIAIARDFAFLHELVERGTAGVKGVGPLLVYDISCRIGRHLGLLPQQIFMHCGTKKGAKALGLDAKAAKLSLSTLPMGLRSLNADEAEDVLCVYRVELERLQRSQRTQAKQRSCSEIQTPSIKRLKTSGRPDRSPRGCL